MVFRDAVASDIGELTNGELAEHYRTVAGATGLPLCIYNNPGTTDFTFPEALIAELAACRGSRRLECHPIAAGGRAGLASFKAHGNLRMVYAITDRLSLPVGDPPRPRLRVYSAVDAESDAALDPFAS